ncbi:winged helix DNA-binding domain-containing protein [soil metagenome]
MLTVSADELNRATLARQLLLERSPLEPVAAVRALVGLQAQEPASPYLALWTRLAGFDPAALDAAWIDRRLVKGTLMRQTLHAVAAVDYPMFWAAHVDSFGRAGARLARFEALGIGAERVTELTSLALSHADVPRANPELTAYLTELGGPLGDRDWWWAIRGMAPFVHVPAAVPWGFTRRPSYVAARSWLPWTEAGAQAGLDELVRRYLAAFGPAGVADIAQFTRLEITRVRAAVDRLGTSLRRLRGPDGADLVDLRDAAIPGADTPAPVRFLPMWDSVLLAYRDRSRVIPAEVRKMVIRTNGDVLPTFLVDGRVAGLWRAELVRGRTRIRYRPFGRLPRAVRAELDAEAAALAVFVEPLEPEVYRRYARWWVSSSA